VPSEHTIEGEGHQVTQGTSYSDPGNTGSKSEAVSFSYEVTCEFKEGAQGELPQGSYIEARGSSLVEGHVLVHLVDAHGLAAAAARGEAEAQVGSVEAKSQGNAELAIAHHGSNQVGGSFQFSGMGVGVSAQIATAGTEEKSSQIADTALTTWVTTKSGLASISWNGEYSYKVKKPVGQSLGAMARAKYSIKSLAVIDFRVVSPPPPPPPSGG